MYEVLDANINLRLNDTDAIRGVQRTERILDRKMKQIARKKAVISIEGDLKDLKKDLKEAEALQKAHQKKVIDLQEKSNRLSGAAKNSVEKRLAAERDVQSSLADQIATMRKQRDVNRAAVADLKDRIKHHQLEEQKIQATYQAERGFHKAILDNEKALNNRNKEIEKGRKAVVGERAEVAKLQQAYNKLFQEQERRTQRRGTIGGRLREAAAPDIRQKVELDQRRTLAEMEVLRAKLAAMGAEPIEIHTKLDRGNILARLAGVGDVGLRLGPFAGTVSQFGKALLALGPIVTGIVGYLGALAGAIGAGLAGAAGLGAGALAAFGLSLGGVGLLIPSLLRDFKNLNTLNAAYHKQVLKTGADSDKAKTKLEEFNHALGEVSPTTREAFTTLQKLQDRWRGMSHAARPDFLNAFSEAMQTVNADFGIFEKRTLQAFHAVTQGWNEWMQGLRSADAQHVIDGLMANANRAIPSLMHGLGQIAGAVGRVALSFSRYLKPELDRFDRWATGLNRATTNTRGLDSGVDDLMHSFHGLWDVLTATAHVLEQFTLTAMGPGGHAMTSLADGLNGIADSIAADRAGENKLGKFLSESIDTTNRLYHAIQPLLALFMEFTTIMRPFTDALLSIIGPISKVTESFLSLEPVRKALQAWAALWLFNRGTTAILTNVASSMNLVAKAMAALAGSRLLTKLGPLGRALGLGAAAGGAGAANLAARGTAGSTAAQGAVGGATGAGAGGLLRGLGRTGGTAAAGGLLARLGAPAAGAGLAGLGKNLVGALGGSLLTGVMRATIWGAIGISMFKGIKEGFKHGVGAGAMEMAHTLSLGLLPKPRDYAEIDRKITDDIDRIEKLAQQRSQAAKAGIKLEIDFKHDKFDQGMQNVLDSLGRMKHTTVTTLGQARSSMQQQLELMSRSINIHGANGKKVMGEAYRSMAASIKRGMDRGLIDTRRGTQQMHEYLIKALAALGIKGRANQEGYLATQEFRANTHSGGGPNTAATGYIGGPGEVSRDMIPLMVGRGEAVLNRHQQKWVNAGLNAIGVDGLPELFARESTPHYMNQGGIAGAATGYANKRGQNGPREQELGFSPLRKPGKIPRARTNMSGLWGQVAQGTLDKYRSAAQRKLSGAWNTQGGGGLGMGVGAALRGGAALARAMGLIITSTTGGKHAPNSWHYKGRAIDSAGSPSQMMAFFKAAAGKWGKHILELFYDPAGWYIKNGNRVTGAIGGHSDHVHLAMARGGFAGAARGKSPLSRIYSRVLGRAPGLSAFNHQYKKGSKETLDPMVIRAIGEALGMTPTEALHMMQITKGESSRQPGAISNDGGIGLTQTTPRVWGAKAKKFLAQLGGENALLNPIINMAMAKFLMDDRKSSGQDPLGPWYGTKYLRRGSRAKGSALGMFKTKGVKATDRLTRGATGDLANILALDEMNMDRAQNRTPFNYADDIWNAGAQVGHLRQQNKGSFERIKEIDKSLKGRMTPANRSAALSERAGLISGITGNRQKIRDLKSTASDNLFEMKQGVGRDIKSINYNKALAGSTETLNDDIDAAKVETDYWEARIDWLQTHGGKQEDIVDAINNWNTAKDQVKSLQDQQASDLETIKRLTLAAANAQAALTPDLNDDLAAAQANEDWVQGLYDVAVATNDTAGIAKWGPELKAARDEVSGIKEQIGLMGPQTAQMMASLTTDLNDDVAAAQQLVDYYQGIYNVATGAEKIQAGQNLAGARSDLQSATRNAELLPLERNAAFAALTETLDDDKAATVALRDYWAGQLENAKRSGDIPAQIEAAQNLKGLNDQINEAQKTVAEQMVILSDARRDLYKAFSNNFVSQIPAGTLAPQASTTYAGTTVNVTNNFQEPPPDPHTWSAGVSWELQAAV